MSKKILIAKVISPHGIRGEVKMVVFCDEIEDLAQFPLFDKNGEEKKITIKDTNKKTKTEDPIVIAKIDGIDDRNKSEEIRGMELFANRDDFKDLGNDEFYISDLIGMDVKQGDEKIAKILNVYDFGGGAMLELEFLDGKAPKGYDKIENIAFKDEFFPEVNLDGGFVEVELPEAITMRKDS